MVEITISYLERQIARAEYCASASIALGQLASLLALALRAAGLDDRRLAVLNAYRQPDLLSKEVQISGDDLRFVLALALEAKREEVAACQPRWLH
jgi:hypothetical protein